MARCTPPRPWRLISEFGEWSERAEAVHVIGVSMGGMIAQSYALNYREGEDEIASLTLACTYAAPGPFCSRMFELWRDMARRMSIADVHA